jgi:excisionase family DNA binding protein
VSALLTIAEAARALNVSTRTVQRLIADRQIKVVKVRRSTRVTADEVARYAKARERLA